MDLIEKINLLKKINTDDSNFIVKVFEAYQKKQHELEIKKETSTIIVSAQIPTSSKNIIDLDKIWVKPYLYTRMRTHLDQIIKLLILANKNDIISNPSKFCNKIIFHKLSKTYEKSEDDIDIVEFIQSLDERKKTHPEESFNFIFTAKNLDEETLFKEEQLTKAIEILNITDYKKRNEKIYDEIYAYLETNFVANNYCDFCNNKCVAQRKLTLYPLNRKNGCCFTQIRTCPHLHNGSCNIECLPCRLFSCPYLTKRGIGYWASDFILIKAFYNKSQRKHIVHDFYTSKSEILAKINKKSNID